MIKINGMEDGVFDWPPPSQEVVWDVFQHMRKRRKMYTSHHTKQEKEVTLG